jgi:hypothetical protein
VNSTIYNLEMKHTESMIQKRVYHISDPWDNFECTNAHVNGASERQKGGDIKMPLEILAKYFSIYNSTKKPIRYKFSMIHIRSI